MSELKESIESGKQRGVSSNMIIKDISCWADAAIQKYNNNYIVHVSLIEEHNMASEKYKKYFTRSFSTFDQALSCIENESEFSINELGPIKGQLIFDPEHNEENT